MKKLLGVFDTKKMTAEQIYEEVIKSLKKKERKMIKNKSSRDEQR